MGTLKVDGHIEGKYLKSEWLYTSAATAKTSVNKIACIGSDNYIYYITPANMNVGRASILNKNATKLNTDADIDAFLNNGMQLTWIGSDITGLKNDGAVLSIGQGSGWGAQLWIDDGAGSGGMAVRSRKNTTTWNDWKPILTSANYSNWACPASGSNNYIKVYNSNNVGGSSTVTFNDLAKQGFAAAMIHAAEDNPRGAAGWIHGLSMAWGAGSNTDWISQLAFGVQDSNGLWYRTNSSACVGKPWKRVLDSSNYNSYSPTLTGGGASGTWNINVSGQSATTATVEIRSINDYNNFYDMAEGKFHLRMLYGNKNLPEITNAGADVSGWMTGIAWYQSDAAFGAFYYSHQFDKLYFANGSNRTTFNHHHQIAYLDQVLPLSGGTMSGSISFTSTDPFYFYGAGTETFTLGCMYVDNGGLVFETPRSGNSTAYAPLPFRVASRGGWQSGNYAPLYCQKVIVQNYGSSLPSSGATGEIFYKT